MKASPVNRDNSRSQLPSASLVELFLTINEKELTDRFVIPLFKALGYSTVDYHGGHYEGGKDLICWGNDETGDIRLAVAQIKQFKPSVRANDHKSFSEVVTQLSQAAEKPVPNLNGQAYIPNAIYFITPHVIDTRALTSRFEGYHSLRYRGVRIIDGVKLAELVIDKLPDVVADVLGIAHEVHQVTGTSLSNEILLAALGYDKRKDIREFYTDIDFTLGHVTTRLFFGASFGRRQKTFELSHNDWQTLKTTCDLAAGELHCSLMTSTPRSIESLFSKRAREFEKLNDKISAVVKEIRSLEGRLSESHHAFDDMLEEIRRVARRAEPATKLTLKKLTASLLQIQSQIKQVWQDSNPDIDDSRRRGSTVKRELCQLRETNRDTILQIDRVLPTTARSLSDTFDVQCEIADLLHNAHSRRANLPAGPTPPKYRCTIDTHELSRKLNHERRSIVATLTKYNSTLPDTETLRGFLKRCDWLFGVTATVLENKHVAEVLGIPSGTQFALSREKYRLSMPIHVVFDTRLNIVVFGDAGAGKTTSLQMFALQRMESQPRQLSAFVPLGRLVTTWFDRGLKVRDGDTPKLEEGIAYYYASLGATVSIFTLQRELAAGNAIVLLDGVDEAIKRAPWLLSSIASLADRYRNAQVITSSRMSVEYLQHMPFLGVTLLPFSLKQQTGFIKAWFGTTGKAHVRCIERHLKEHVALREIVRNPLLATVLCTLQENSIPLPDTEISLYQERLQLLLGYYDQKKRISRLRFRRDDLEDLCRQLAIALHFANKREADTEWYYKHAESILASRSRRLDARAVVDELIDPCNVLVPMTDDGKFGFGHLRYQEFLVAVELLKNRSIQLVPRMVEPWWQGVFVLLAQLVDDLEWLINDVTRAGYISRCSETLEAMVSVRPSAERRRLKEILQMEYHGANTTNWLTILRDDST